MNEVDLHFFIDSTVNYFDRVTGSKPICGIPFLKGDKDVELEYTGIIGISGKRKGNIYITANAEMLKELAHLIIGPQDVSANEIKDLIGEMANTISGNLRQAYGSDFLISVPVVIECNSSEIEISSNLRSYVIPLIWNDYESYLVACLE